MADYTIIADISAYILQHLREEMCPSLITSPSGLEITSPVEQNRDCVLGLYLYDIQEEGEIASPPMRRSGQTMMRRISKPYTLHYMIFVNGSSQSGMKNQDMLKVVGRAAQVVNDMESVLPNTLQPWLEQGEPPVTLFPARLKLEDKVRVWQAVDKPYGLSLFYRASPVFLSSKIALEVPRVREASFTLLPPEEGGRGS
ncbi:MAG: DUF4255 domain-containing protein [Hungatella hathewayi]|nr:DUF4255 domain-containing protein [Hungatella hathewayi]MBS5063448.1 DUF4255 domain-containing protein [Hungatella hathewayi]